MPSRREQLLDYLTDEGIPRETVNQFEELMPAWHDRPTCPGLWVGKFRDSVHRSSFSSMFTRQMIEIASNKGNTIVERCRWFGPIPQETE